MIENFPQGHRHLGGHEMKTHIDSGVLEYAKNNFKINTMIDIGCGPGGMVELARKMGIDSYGIDGDFRLEREIPTKYFLQDFTEGKATIVLNFDLAYSCEFVEHVEEKYIPNYMDVFSKANHVIMTFAPPKTPGHHHVNCKPQEYWVDVFKEYNFTYDEKISREIRAASTMQRDFMRNTGLYFRKLG